MGGTSQVATHELYLGHSLAYAIYMQFIFQVITSRQPRWANYLRPALSSISKCRSDSKYDGDVLFIVNIGY